MWLSIGLVVVGLVLVVFFSEQLVRGTVGFARGFGLSTFLVSAVFLGFDPENLAVGAVGSAGGDSGIALGTILGSAMVAVALAFGIAGVVAPMRFEQVPRQVLAVPIVAVLFFGTLALDGILSRVDGAILTVGYVAAVGYLIWLSRRGLTIRASGEIAKEMVKAERLGKGKSTALLVVSIIMVIVASEILVTGATDLISRFGLSQTLVGMTVVALALSAEEVARTVPAALRGHGEISVGNVLGSVLAFFLLNAGVIALVAPIPVGAATLHFYLPVAVGTIVLISALLLARRLPRWAGALLILIYIGFIVGGYALYGATSST
ncbi:sodium:calcium antiporter [Cryobacterium sp. TMT1-19]|uniref:sodium:calcium antiporter n=1 Tax=unclassified Cryobacterium TaxID=2649013 RepID=UPI000CE5743D|nr:MULTISPECIES: sodium:calcium antiporter [unclassified Cryobacterium]TFD38344.1 sodium:calcium antiporter [Cryobacterium sp. TMT1-19]